MTSTVLAQMLAALVSACAAVVGVVMLAPSVALDRHMLGHVLVVDVAAACAVLALPASFRSMVVDWIDRHAERSGARSVLINCLRSPAALLGAWTAIVSVLMLPFGHRWAVTSVGRWLEPVVLFAVGFALWRVTFHDHRRRPFLNAIVHGGLVWWGRHVLVMVGRILILPAILILWFIPAERYVGADAGIQELAAGVVLAAEMSIFGAAFILFFVLFLRAGHESDPKPLTTHQGPTDGV